MYHFPHENRARKVHFGVKVNSFNKIVKQSQFYNYYLKSILISIVLIALPVRPLFYDAAEGRSFGAIGSPTTVPEMVDIAGGRYVIGSPVDELGRYASEGPQHEVSVARFQISRTEVTVGQFSAFLEATDYAPDGTCIGWDRAKHVSDPTGSYSWNDPGYPQRSDHPVVCVSWFDAEAYVSWLNEIVPGGGYRLPTESEWEFVARAGTSGAVYWSDSEADPSQAACKYANGLDEAARRSGDMPTAWSYLKCDDGWVHTSPVGTYQPNSLGIFDMIGNVYEWTGDCWHSHYVGEPDDGTAWRAEMGGNCDLVVVRGGSRLAALNELRSASRKHFPANSRATGLGFRVARSLPDD